MIKKEYQKLAERFDRVMNDIGCEHICITEESGEVISNRRYYGIEDGITIGWMFSEVCYWLSCYYESGNVRCDDKKYDYSTWISETGKLKRLKKLLESYPDGNEIIEA